GHERRACGHHAVSLPLLCPGHTCRRSGHVNSELINGLNEPCARTCDPLHGRRLFFPARDAWDRVTIARRRRAQTPLLGHDAQAQATITIRGREVLGALYADLGAFTFALNNATLRRGVLTGTVMQAMAVTAPVGAAAFLMMAIFAGAIPALLDFPSTAAAWMAGQGIVHFVIGRFFNYRANQLVGVNLSAPFVQLQVVVAMLLAVLTMHEPFTVLQTIGAVLMLAGSFATQRRTSKPSPAALSRDKPATPPAFKPHYVAGY